MNVAIVVAAGRGVRLGGKQPKQFLKLAGVPIIIHTLKQFERSQEINEVITVLPAEETAAFLSLAQKLGLRKPLRAVTGGPTRARSVWHGLNSIIEAEIVAVHDGVRPFVTPDEIDKTVRAAKLSGAAILCAPVNDTIKEVEAEKLSRTLARSGLCRALTPQSFRYDLLKQAYEQLDSIEIEGVEVTDDSFLVERLGVEVVAVSGSARNIKITNEEDLLFAETILKSVVSCP